MACSTGADGWRDPTKLESVAIHRILKHRLRYYKHMAFKLQQTAWSAMVAALQDEFVNTMKGHVGVGLSHMVGAS